MTTYSLLHSIIIDFLKEKVKAKFCNYHGKHHSFLLLLNLRQYRMVGNENIFIFFGDVFQ